MQHFNPLAAAAQLAGDPAENAAKKAKAVDRLNDCTAELTKYRLYYGDIPVGMLVECYPMEVHAWNKNARAFYHHQCTLGRDRLPILEYREEKDESAAKMFRVFYRQNGREQHRDFVAESKAEAKREFEKIASVAALILKVEPSPEPTVVAKAQSTLLPEAP